MIVLHFFILMNPFLSKEKEKGKKLINNAYNLEVDSHYDL